MKDYIASGSAILANNFKHYLISGNPDMLINYSNK